MFGKIRRLIRGGINKATTRNCSARRHLRFEPCEDRRMLAAMADILFLVDESGTEQDTHTQDWFATVVDDLHAALTAADIDAQYGLIGFGEGLPPQGDDARFAHTQLLGPTGSKEDWTTSETELASAMNNDLADLGAGPSEDGWDTIEHAIAEYDFREGAVPILVLVQGDQGRTILNDTLTRNGTLAALQSKNAILNSIVAGQLLADGEPPTGFVEEPLLFRDGPNESDPPLDPQPVVSWAPIFDLATYGLDEDIYVLGVEADSADGLRDRSHAYHAFDTVNDEVPGSLTTTESDALQISYNGSNTGDTGMIGSGKSILIGQTMTGGIGPTAEGYSAKSVPFSVVDMTGATEHTNLANSISYSFPFYGTTETSLWVNEDGTISFDSAFTTGANVDLSQAVAGQTRPSDPLVAAWNEKAAFALAA